ESDVLALEVLHDEFTGGSALLRVAGHHAEGGLEALFGVFGRRGHGDLRQAGIVVHARGGNGGARVEVTQHALHAFVDDLLRNLNGRTRVSLVVATDQHKLGSLPVELNLLFVRFFKGEREAVPHVFAVMRLRAGERCRKAQFDDLFRRSRGNGKGGQGSGRGGQQLEAGSGLHDCLHVWNGGDDGI